MAASNDAKKPARPKPRKINKQQIAKKPKPKPKKKPETNGNQTIASTVNKRKRRNA